jgi:hypothetical protein
MARENLGRTSRLRFTGRIQRLIESLENSRSVPRRFTVAQEHKTPDPKNQRLSRGELEEAFEAVDRRYL